MGYTAKNHTEGADKLVIGGALVLEEGATLMLGDKIVDLSSLAVGVPDAPTITAGTPTATSIPVTITAVNGATKYLYRYKKPADADWGGVVDNGNKTTFTISGLTAKTEYTIEAAVVNIAGQSVWDDGKAIHVTTAES